jgi:outer membrane protein TolC
MKRRNVLPVFLAAVIFTTPALSVYAAEGPGQAQKSLPEGITTEQWSQLNDQTIEFDELSNLVRYFNPDVQNMADSLNINVENVEYVHDNLRKYIKDLEDDAKEVKDSGGTSTPEGMEQYMTLVGTVKVLKSNAENAQKSIKKLKQSNSTINFNITQMSRQYENIADQVMIGYNNATANRALLQKVVELSNAAYEAQELGLRIGTATQTDVLSAKKELLSAQSSLMNLDNTIDGLRRSLGLLTGYSSESIPVIEGLPELDLQTISSIDLQADTAKAIGNNYDLINMRRANSNKTTTGMENKQASVSEGEQNVAVTMQSLYQNVKQAKTAYEATLTSYEKAGLDKGKAERSFQMGMLSKITYLQSQMAFLQAEGAKGSAYTDLYQAYTTYQWAVKGIISDSQK